MASALNVLLPEDHSAMEGMKQKVLQGGLTAIACLGYLLGHRDVSSAISDDRLLYFLRAYFSEVRRLGDDDEMMSISPFGPVGCVRPLRGARRQIHTTTHNPS